MLQIYEIFGLHEHIYALINNSWSEIWGVLYYTNIGRYERGEAVPSANVLNNLAQALDVTPDYLINGTLEDKAENTISDNELLMQFKKVEKLPGDKKKLVKEFLDAFLFKDNVQKQLVL